MKQEHWKQNRASVFRRFVRKGYGAFNSLHRVVNIGVLAGAALGLAYAETAVAQQVVVSQAQTEGEADDEQLLEEVMVTASKVATPLSQAAKQLTVVSQKEIAKAPIRSIQDLLVYMAGVDVTQRGAHGVQADISIRGGSFDQNIVLLNGVNLSSAQSGHLTYDIPLNISDIERIEIVHGPAALIHGAGAFSGAINIITKKEVADRIFAQVTAGAHGLWSVEGRAAADWGKTTHSISVSHKSSDGYRENTDYRLYNALWQSRLKLGSTDRLDFQLGYNNKAFGANAFYSPKGPKQYEKTNHLFTALKGEFGKTLRVVPILYWSRAHDEYHWQRGTAMNNNRADNLGANLVGVYTSPWGTTSLGGEWRRESLLSTNLGSPMDEPVGKYTKSAVRTNLGLSLEHTVTLGRFSVSAGALLNHNTQRQGKLNFLPSVNATYRPNTYWTFSASWGKAIRIPTFTDLYYKGPKQVGHNDLRPERSESLELSAKLRRGPWQAYVTTFGQWGRDMIDWAKPTPEEEKFHSMNLSRLDTYGVEAGVSLRLGEYLRILGEEAVVKLDYARMTQSHDSEGLKSLYALRYLRDKLTLHLSHALAPRLTASWFLRYQKRMGVFESGTDALGKPQYANYPAFATLDLRLDYRPCSKVEVYAALNNLTNKTYFDIAAVPQPGFWASTGVSFRLGK